MIETGFDRRVQINQIIQNQIPEFLLEESPKYSEFLKQYYISQEFQGGTVDIAENLDQYLKLDNLTPEVVNGSTKLSFDINSTSGIITVTSTKGFPSQYGLLKIDDEIITYTGVTTNTFIGCIRGFSGITSYHRTNNPEELEFSTSKATSHLKFNSNTEEQTDVNNLSSLFLQEFYKKIKYTLTPGLEDSNFVSELDVNNFIKEAKSFYQAKGTDESFRILFKVLYGVDVKVVDLEQFLIKPSSSNYVRRENLIVEAISGDPLKLVGQTIIKKSDPITKGSVSEVEILTRKNKIYFKVSLFVTNDDFSREGNFEITGSTKVLETVSIGSSIIPVDSTIGFPKSGKIISKNNENISYISKSINQFLGCSGIFNPILTAENVRSDEIVYGYEDGDTSKIVELRITGVLSKFSPQNDILYTSENEKIYVKCLGDIIENPDTNRTYKEIFANSWIYNTSSRYQIDKISGGTFTLKSAIDKSSLRVGDNIEILYRDSERVFVSNASVATVNENSRQITLNNIGAFSPDPYTDYDIRRKIKKSSSLNVPLEYGNNNLISNIQNVYVENGNSNYGYIASNSLPEYEVELKISKAILDQANGNFLQDYNDIEKKYATLSFADSVPFLTGDTVIYYPENTSIPELETNKVYYVEVLDLGNRIRLYTSNTSIGTANYISYTELEPGTGSHKFTLYRHRKDLISPQKILRKFPLSQNIKTGTSQKTDVGAVGVLVNGVEIISPKSYDEIRFGPLQKINVTNSGEDYDVINPPKVSISDPENGTTALANVVVTGSVKSVLVDPQDFDIDKVSSITLTGGNGSGAIFQPNIRQIFQEYSFDARPIEFGGGIDSDYETITFRTPHTFKDGDNITYNSNGSPEIGIGNFGGLNTNQSKYLINGSSYYAKVINTSAIKLYNNFNDYMSGINTIGFTNVASGGIQKFRTPSKNKLVGISVINSGSGYENKQLYVNSSGISTQKNTIYFPSHNFKEGELVNYSYTENNLSGLSTDNQYYVLKIDDNTFRLANAGIGGSITSNYERRNYINFLSVESGYHIFSYPEIKLTVNVSYTSSTFETIVATPLITGKISDCYLYEPGSGYGSDILNSNKKPSINLKSGKGAEVSCLVSEDKIISVEVLFSGSEYYSTPSLLIKGSGTGAILRPVISDGKLSKVIVINGGVGYTKNTSIKVISRGKNCKLDCAIRPLTINNQYRFGNEILLDTKVNNLKYGFLGYSLDIANNYFDDLKKINGYPVHSPIIGWAYDGNPIYGPYGYSDPEDSNSDVKSLSSGYKLDPENIQNRPDLNKFPAGFFNEDFIFDNSGDLDIYNGRYTKTPDFQNGIYAYFASVFDDLKTSRYPYFIGSYYRSELIKDNFYLDQSKDFSSGNLVRNTFPYKINDPYSGNDFLIESNEIVNQVTIISSSSKGSINALNILDQGDNYKVGDSIIFDNTETGGGGLSAIVSEVIGKKIVAIDTEIESYNDSIFTWKDGESILVTVYPSHSFHNLTNNDTVIISGLSSSILNLTSYHNVGVNTESMSLIKNISDTFSGIVTDIYVSNVPTNVSIGSSISIGNEILSVLNIFENDSILRVRRNVGSAHSASSLVNILPNQFSIKIKSKYFDSKLNDKVYFNPIYSVGVGTISGFSNLINYTIGETSKSISIPSQSIYLPDHQFKTGQKIKFTKKPYAVGLDVIDGDSQFPFLLPLIGNSQILYVINKSKDFIGLCTNVGVTTNTDGIFFIDAGSNNYEYSIESVYPQVTGNVDKIKATVSISTSHRLKVGDMVSLQVNPNTSGGIGISSTVKVSYNPENDLILVNPVGFGSESIDLSFSTIQINSHGLKTGDKIFYDSEDLIASGLSTGSYFIYRVDDNIIKLSSTYIDTQLEQPNIISIGSTGGKNQVLSLINPQLSVVKNSSLIFDLSDSSLSDYKLKIFYDSNFNNEFISVGNTANFSINQVGISSLELRYSEDLPQKLYYGLSKNQSTVNSDIDVKNYSEILFNNSAYNGDYKVVGCGETNFEVLLNKIPERTSYTKFNTDILSYSTTSKNVVGGIKKCNVISGGNNYKKLPKFKTINSIDGKNAYLVPLSNNIGIINKTRNLDQGFEYPSDNTLNPKSDISKIVFTKKRNNITSVEVINGGKNYLSPPDLLIFNPKENIVEDSQSLSCKLSSGAISVVNLIFQPHGLDSTEQKIVAINNNNGVGISSVSCSGTLVTCELYTPILGFDANNQPFAVGDRIFVENITSSSNDGSGFNSKNYNYEFFTITNYENTNPVRITFDLVEFTENPGIPSVKQTKFPIAINEKNYPKFKVHKELSYFNVGEQLSIILNGQLIAKDLFVTEVENDYIKVKGSYELTPEEIIVGNITGIRATVDKLKNNDGKFEISYSSLFDIGNIDNIGNLSDSYQIIPNNDYYQNLSYTIKSSIEYEKFIDPINRLLHSSGLKNFGDLNISSSSSISYASTTSDQTILDILNENRVDTINNFEFVIDYNIDQDRSKYLKFQNKRLTNYILCLTNRVLVIDDISNQFTTTETGQTDINVSGNESYVELDSLNSSCIRYLIQLINPNNNNIQLTELVVLSTNSNVFVLEKQSLSNNEDIIGEFYGNIDDLNYKTLRFLPSDIYNSDYDIKILSSRFQSSVSAASTLSIGFIDLISNSSNVSSGSTVSIKSFNKNKVNSFFANLHIVDLTTGRSDYVEIYANHDSNDVYYSEYYFDDNITSGSNNYIGSITPSMSGELFSLDFYNNTSNKVLVDSKIVGFGSTSLGSSTYRFKVDGQSPGNERSAYYSSNYTKTSSTSSIITINKLNCSALKSLVKVSYGQTSSLHQVMLVQDNSDIYITQYPFLSIGSTTGIGTFGGEYAGNNTILKFYPDPSISGIFELESFSEVFYTLSDNLNKYPDLFYGKIIERISVSSFSGKNGSRSNKYGFDLTFDRQNIFAKQFNPENSSELNLITGEFNIENHFFSNGERLIYTPKSTIVGLGTSSLIMSDGFDLPPEVYVSKINLNKFKLSLSQENALVGICVTFNSPGSGNAHQLEMYKKLEKCIISLDGVVQQPLTFTPISYVLEGNGGQISAGSTYFALSGIATIHLNELLKVDNEYMKIISVGFGTTSVGPIIPGIPENGDLPFSLVNVQRGFVGTSATNHLDFTEVRVTKGAFNIVDSVVHFTFPPRGRGKTSLGNDNLPYPVSIFDGRVYLQDDYNNNKIYDDISNEFTGIGQTFSLTVQGINTSGISTGNGILFINDIFQTPTTENNLGNNYYFINEGGPSGITSVTFTGITSSNGQNFISNEDVNQNQLPRGGVIISLGSTQGLGFAPLVGASVTAVIDNSGTIISVGIGSMDNLGSGYYGTVSVGVTQVGHTGSGAIIESIVGSGGTLGFNIIDGGSGYSANPSIIIPTPVYENLPVTGVFRRGIGNTSETGKNILLTLDVGPNSTLPIGRNADAARLILNNKQLIADVAIGRMLAHFPSFSVPGGNQNCISDIINVLESISYNLENGGNDLTYDAAKIYIDNAYLSGEEEQSIYAFEQARDLAIQVMRNDTITINGYSTLTQYFDNRIEGDISGDPGVYTPGDCADVASAIGSFVGIVTFAIGESTLPSTRTIAPLSLYEVKSFKVAKPGYSFEIGDVFKPVGLVTAKGLSSPIKDFELTVLDVFYDSFYAWQFGDLNFIDSIKSFQDGKRTRFPLYYKGDLLSFEKDLSNPDSSKINLDAVLIVFVNGVIQQPGLIYKFEGGTSFRFITPPTPEDIVSVFFYEGSAGVDTKQVSVIPSLEIGDTVQVFKNSKYSNTITQNPRIIGDIATSDVIETNLYNDVGVDDTNFKPISWTKQKSDKVINGAYVYKSRDSIESLIFPTAKIIKNIDEISSDIFLDDARFFNYEENDPNTNIILSSMGGLIINPMNNVSAAVTATVSVGGTISNLTINNPGLGYTALTTIKISAPKQIGIGIGTTATATISILNGSIDSYTIENCGLGYDIQNPPQVIISEPLFKNELLTGINEVEGFSGIVTGITTTNGVNGNPLALKFFINVENNTIQKGSYVDVSNFDKLNEGYPILITGTSVGNGILSILDDNSQVIGVGTTFLDNIYYLSNYSSNYPNAEFVCNVHSGANISGISTFESIQIKSVGNFSWGRLTNLDRSKNPISIGVSGLTVDSDLSTFPTIQRRLYGMRETGGLRKILI